MRQQAHTSQYISAGLDEGLLSFSLPILAYMENPYRYEHMTVANDSAPSLRRGSFPLPHLIFSYYAVGCVARCTRDDTLRCFPLSQAGVGGAKGIHFWNLQPRASPPLSADIHLHVRNNSCDRV